jgi:hypothetical protein
MLDMIVDRRELKTVLARALRFMGAVPVVGSSAAVEQPELVATPQTTGA